jgi:hypothetical protein
MTLSPLVQTAPHYQGQQSNLAMGADGSRHFKASGQCPLYPQKRTSEMVMFGAVARAVSRYLPQSAAQGAGNKSWATGFSEKQYV